MNQKIFKRRTIITGFFILLTACFFIFRFIDLHFSDKIKISAKEYTDGRRGYIKDRSGHILAVSIEKNSLYANPEEIKDPRQFSEILSKNSGISEKKIFDRINREKRFVWLDRKIDDDLADRIGKLNLKGVHFRKEFHRVYPNGRLAANIIGFTDIDNNGLAGIEYKFNDILLPKDTSGIFSRETRPKSYDLILTVDRYIQHIAEREIQKAVTENKAQQGAVLVMEVKTGKLLCAAKYPGFDPNFYSKFSNESRSSYSIVNSFEPGSTFKTVALAAILEKNPDILKKSYICTGSVEIGDTVINCTKVHGRVNIFDIIRESCNAGLIQAMKDVSRDDFYGMLKKFGFGEKTGIDLPGESLGILRKVGDWSGLSKYSISIGQEISVTSLQLIAAYSAIANNGLYNYPSVIERIETDDGALIDRKTPRVRGRIISENNAKIILKILRSVVSDGTGKMAEISYYRPAGKTGTAQKSTRVGYYGENVASFIGVAPYDDPDICVLVILDEPQISTSGGDAAAPVFAVVMEKALISRGVRNNYTKPPEPVIYGKRAKKFDGSTMPDFTGLSMPEAISLLTDIKKKINVTYKLIGSGRVIRQTPEPKEKLTYQKEIILYLQK